MISQKRYPVQHALHKRVKDSLWSMGKYAMKLAKRRRKLGLESTGPFICIYYEEPTNPQSVDYEILCPVETDTETTEIKRLGGETCAYTRVKGSYSKLVAAYKALSEYVEKENLEVSAPPREVYVRRPLLGFLVFIPTMITDIYFPLKE